MGATISWIPTSKARRVLDAPAPSTFISAMGEVFGPAPWTLDGTHTHTLEAMAAAYGGKNNPFTKLVGIIERREEIQVDWSN